MPPEETILEEAARLVIGNRRDSYGHPKDDFDRTGRMWGAILSEWALKTQGKEPIPAELVALCMIALKVSREVHTQKRDNLVDVCGYAYTCQLVYEKKANE